MIEKHIILEDVDPVVFYGVNNVNIQMVKALYPKLRIVARGNVLHVIGDELEMCALEENVEKLQKHCHKYNSLTEEDILHILRGERGAFTLRTDKQNWQGSYLGNGIYVVTYSPKAPATLAYTITSDIPGFPSHEGVFTVGSQWPAVGKYSTVSSTIKSEPYKVGNTWWTDCGAESLKSGKSDYEDYAEHNSQWQGAATVSVWREAVMRDWEKRFKWMDNR